jgi:hypothetical protein
MPESVLMARAPFQFRCADGSREFCQDAWIGWDQKPVTSAGLIVFPKKGRANIRRWLRSQKHIIHSLFILQKSAGLSFSSAHKNYVLQKEKR